MQTPPIERSSTQTAQHVRPMLACATAWAGLVAGLLTPVMALADGPPRAGRTGNAGADVSASCRAIRARASLEASLLIGPRLMLSGLRFPAGRDVDLPTGETMQVRIGLTVTPFEIYRGIRVLDSAEVDCRLENAAAQLEAWLQAVEQSPDLSARRAQRAYLATHQPEWATLIEQAQARRDANVITMLEFNDVQSLVTQLERKFEQSKTDPTVPTSAGEPVHGQLGALLKDYTDQALERERRFAGDRATEAWSLRITGGVIPLPTNAVDWFGIAELTYNLGGLFQGSASSELVAARREVLQDEPRGLVQRARNLSTRFSAQRAQAQRELRALEERLSFLERALSALASADTPAIAHVRDALTLERYASESERAYLLASTEALSTFIEEVHASGQNQQGQH